MKMTGLDHITVNVTDLEKSRFFYENVLELSYCGFIDMGDHTLTYYTLPQGVRLELIDYVDKDKAVSVPETHIGMYRHFCLVADSLAQ
ncbi:MAG: VOC family protein, partial [Blautia sp.]|nr:VOC family protein [Blautia sp.]